MKKISLLFLLFILQSVISAFADNYWQLDSTCNAIIWNVNPSQYGHHDHIEMSGKKVSAVLRYGVNPDGSFYMERGMVWPMLRTVPNNTHASLMRRVSLDPFFQMTIAERQVKEKVKSIKLDGTMTVVSDLNNGWLTAVRRYTPSTTLPMLIEKYSLTNNFNEPLYIVFPQQKLEFISPEWRGTEGQYRITAYAEQVASIILPPGETYEFGGYVTAGKLDDVIVAPNYDAEFSARENLVSHLTSNLILETPDANINRMFNFSKIRAAESIYATKCGPMHGPGGESYYAAIWANDQAEYANPFFPFLGYDYANKSAECSFEHFAKYMNPEYKPIPSSIIAEGESYWNGAGDRGDAAMIAYGASRYALEKGDKNTALKLWDLIEWCLEYSNRKRNAAGVVESDYDELESRFPAGDANLCTSSLYYDALISAAYLADALKMPSSVAKKYRLQADQLAKDIEAHFGAEVEGFDTYRYYDGNDILRAWICIPLTMGIYNRAEGTAEALFSPRLWTDNGVLTQAGHNVYWDRSTLYALRGVCAAGYVDTALPFIESYSEKRLLGEHVPYAIEAWPEGNQRHLSAESALYARIFTEGILGLRPTGFNSFNITPYLPEKWNNMALRHIRAFNADMDIEVVAVGNDKIKVIVFNHGKRLLSKTIHRGKSLKVKL